jgi:hypothetical protein
VTALAPPLGRALALGLLALVGLALWLVLVEPVRATFARSEASIEDLSYRLGQYARLAGIKPQLEAQKAGLADSLTLEGELVAGATDALAAAALVELVVATVEGNGGKVASVLTLPAEADGTLLRVPVRVELNADIAVLRDVLYALESGRPVVLVDRLEVRPVPIRTVDGRPGEFDPVPLAVALEIHGFRRAETP